MTFPEHRWSFIQNSWESYPSPMKNEGIVGRLADLEEPSSPHFLGRVQSHAVNFSKASLVGKDGNKFAARDIVVSGDVVQVFGTFKSDVWEASNVVLLAPSLKEKNHSNPDLFFQWDSFLQAVTGFFRERGFVAVLTPNLMRAAAPEPHIELFETQFKMGRSTQTLFLPSSPELHLKKSLFQGLQKVFEIKPCFRNGEKSDLHQPEFLMLEWYRAYEGLTEIKKDIHDLMAHLLAVYAKPPLEKSFQEISCRDVFAKFLDFKLTPQTTRSELWALAEKNDLSPTDDDSWDDLYHRLYVEKIEPHLGAEPFFMTDYPPSQAALAKVGTDGWAERFEFYWKGVELANAYNELNDPYVQRQRFLADIKSKKALGKKVAPLDEAFLEILELGMPPSSGVALGLDRLFMLIFQFKNLQSARPFYL